MNEPLVTTFTQETGAHDYELQVVDAILKILDGCTTATRSRVVRYLYERLGNEG